MHANRARDSSVNALCVHEFLKSRALRAHTKTLIQLMHYTYRRCIISSHTMTANDVLPRWV